jgi:MFS family permease
MFVTNLRNSLKRKIVMSDNLKFYIWNGILFTLMTSLSKTYAVKFLYRLGGTGFHVSLYNALPGFIAAFAIMPGIILINNTTNKKLVVGRFFLVSRLFTLCFAFVPFLPTAFQPMVFILITALMNFPESLSVTALQSFSGDIFVPEERATAISLRNKFSTLAQLLSFLVVGRVLSRMGSTEAFIIQKYQIFFAIAFFLGLMEIRTFYKLRENSCKVPKSRLCIKSALINMKANRKYIIFMCCSLLFHFGWQMGWPLFSIYQIDYLGADEGWLTILNITSSITMFLSFSFWNRRIKAKGNASVITAATLGMALTPVLFILSPNLYVLVMACLIMGFFTSGMITVVLSSLLEVAPEDERMIYVGVHATLTSLTLAVAPMIGNVFLSSYGIHIALLATSVFRLIGSAAFHYRSRRVSKSIERNSSTSL